MWIVAASGITLGFLLLFFFAVFFAVLYAGGALDVHLLLGLTVAANIWFWLYGPRISDWIYGTFYDLRWISTETLGERSPEAAAVIERVANEHGIERPKLGVIDDENPNAFTYGSGRWNSRIVVTEGLFTYLGDDERAAVYAHELGHVVHRDFAVMTVATTLLQLLFQVYAITARPLMQSGSTSRQDRARGTLAFVGLAAYLFYWIGQVMVLYLSRVREYYADEFAADVADSGSLSTALIKVAYGILANPTDPELIEANRFRAIQTVAVADDIGLVYHNCTVIDDFEPLRRAFLYDLVNPWARLFELGSTHPLTGKRIRHLSRRMTSLPFDFDDIELEGEVDYTRLYARFTTDCAVIAVTAGLAIGFPVLFIGAAVFGYVPFSGPLFVGGWLAAIGFATIAGTAYSYPTGPPTETSVVDLMADIYASPVRGKRIELSGKLVGRGIPGLVFSEDMLLEDRTGLIYIDYESWLPVVGDPWFGIGRVPDLIGEETQLTGWYLRSNRPVIGLDRMTADGERARGWVKPGNVGAGTLLLAAGLVTPIGYAAIERASTVVQLVLLPHCNQWTERLVVGLDRFLASVDVFGANWPDLWIYILAFVLVFGGPVLLTQLTAYSSRKMPEIRFVTRIRDSGRRVAGWIGLLVVGLLMILAIALTVCELVMGPPL